MENVEEHGPEEEEDFLEPSDDDLQPDSGFSSPLTGFSSEPIGKLKEDLAPSHLPRQNHSKAMERPTPAEEDILDLVEGAQSSQNPHLRVEAGLTYMTDPDRGSLQKLHQDPRFAQLHFRTLENWCKADGWVDKRKRFLQTWATTAYRKLGSAYVQERENDLDLLTQLRNKAVNKLLDGSEEEIPAKSFEGMMTAVVKVSERMQALQENLIQDMMPPDAEGDSPLIGDGEGAAFSDKEMNEIIAATLESRRLAVREAHGIDASASDQQARALQDASDEGEAAQFVPQVVNTTNLVPDE